MKNLSIALAMAASLLALSAHAGPTSAKEANPVSVDVGYGTYTEKLGNTKYSQDVIRAVVEIPLDQTFSTEVHLVTGVGVDSHVEVEVDRRFEQRRISKRAANIDYALGGFVKAKTSVTQSLSGFMRAGFIKSQVSASGYSSSSTNFAYGFGAEYAFNKNAALTVDFTNVSISSGSANIMVIGLKSTF